jgi:hypothetical protein
MDYVEYPVTSSKPTKLDAASARMLAGRRLYVRSGRGYPYIGLRYQGRRVRLHRLLVNAKQGQTVDHINGDVADNRLCNLRIATPSENAINTHTRPRGACAFHGVYRRKDRPADRCYAKFRFRGSYYYVGQFRSSVVAAIFCDKAKRQIVGPYSGLNFPLSIKREKLAEFIASTKGKIFWVVFVKRSDGQERRMRCRTAVTKNISGVGLAFEPAQYSLFNVFDMDKGQYRHIPLEAVLCLCFGGKRYVVE